MCSYLRGIEEGSLMREVLPASQPGECRKHHRWVLHRCNGKHNGERGQKSSSRFCATGAARFPSHTTCRWYGCHRRLPPEIERGCKARLCCCCCCDCPAAATAAIDKASEHGTQPAWEGDVGLRRTGRGKFNRITRGRAVVLGQPEGKKGH